MENHQLNPKNTYLFNNMPSTKISCFTLYSKTSHN